TAGLAGQIEILRKLLIQLRFRRRHPAGRERDAIDEANHALRHRAQIVQHVRPEHDVTERLAPGNVLALPVMLEHELAVLAHQQHMQAVDLAIALRCREALTDVARYILREGARRHQASTESDQQMTAVERKHATVPLPAGVAAWALMGVLTPG